MGREISTSYFDLSGASRHAAASYVNSSRLS
jgi:hypothetical protein